MSPDSADIGPALEQICTEVVAPDAADRRSRWCLSRTRPEGARVRPASWAPSARRRSVASASASAAPRPSSAVSRRTADRRPWSSACTTAARPCSKPSARARSDRPRQRRAPQHARLQRSWIAQPLLGAGQHRHARERAASRSTRARAGSRRRREPPPTSGRRSRCTAGAGLSTLWLVPATDAGHSGARGRSTASDCAATIRRRSRPTTSACRRRRCSARTARASTS